MGHEDAARKSLINLSNFPEVARWSRIKDQQMNRSLDEGKKEVGGNASTHPRLQEEGAISHESVIASYHGPTIRAYIL